MNCYRAPYRYTSGGIGNNDSPFVEIKIPQLRCVNYLTNAVEGAREDQDEEEAFHSCISFGLQSGRLAVSFGLYIQPVEY